MGCMYSIMATNDKFLKFRICRRSAFITFPCEEKLLRMRTLHGRITPFAQAHTSCINFFAHAHTGRIKTFAHAHVGRIKTFAHEHTGQIKSFVHAHTGRIKNLAHAHTGQIKNFCACAHWPDKKLLCMGTLAE